MEDQNVEPAIVVKVVDPAAPTDVLSGRGGNSKTRADVLKALLAGVAHQAVILRVRDPQVQHSVAFDVGEGWSHRRSHLAVLPVGNAQVAANLLKRAIVLVAEEKVLGLVIGD